jgi:hypothetical protein
MGSGSQALQIINIYGQFDHKLIGGSLNIPPEILGAQSVATNFLLKQFIAYKYDDAGKIYFSNQESSPPPCDTFNYSFMIFGDGSDEFGIKSSNWKQGDQDVYKFKISELVPIDMQSFSNPQTWCRAVIPVATTSVKSTDTKSNAGFIALMIILGILGFFLLYKYLQGERAPRQYRVGSAGASSASLGSSGIGTTPAIFTAPPASQVQNPLQNLRYRMGSAGSAYSGSSPVGYAAQQGRNLGTGGLRGGKY